MASLPSLRGERFTVDDADDDHGDERGSESSIAVKDVLERAPVSSAAPPSLPTSTSQSGGFPKHRNRLQQSKFKAQKSRTGAASREGASLPGIEQQLKQATLNDDNGDSDYASIDRENQERLTQMSDEDIRKEQGELMASLDPDVLRFLTLRARHSNSAKSSQLSLPPSTETVPDAVVDQSQAANNKLVAAAQAGAPPGSIVLPAGVHFPQPLQPRELDDSSDTFLDDLHERYFPLLPAEPEKLAWMKATPDTTYSPDLQTVHLASIRFDFKGLIVPPRPSASLPVTMGLHHHGDAPDSAGYTIPELAHLARSTVPMQRCMSFQTLGRILYRLGSGGFGDRLTSVAKAIRQMVAECRVLETLREEVGKENSHLSAKTYATEALWLWQRSGGTEFKAA